MHAPFVKPSNVHLVSLAVAAFPVICQALIASSSERVTAGVSHAPPIFYTPPVSPLRI